MSKESERINKKNIKAMQHLANVTKCPGEGGCDNCVLSYTSLDHCECIAISCINQLKRLGIERDYNA